MNYDIFIKVLSEEDGGGYLGIVPDLKGCFSDGETREEAILNTEKAISDWIEGQSDLGREIPEPGTAIKKANNERLKLLKVISILAEGMQGIEGRMEALETEIKELLESVDNIDAWQRFAALTGEKHEEPSSIKVLC